MSLHTPLCDLLGVKHPIMLAGMGGVSYAELAAAVSNAGGYGVLGMAGRNPDFIREEMRKVKSLTDKPFGVDLLAASPESLTAAVEIIIEEGASSFVAGLGGRDIWEQTVENVIDKAEELGAKQEPCEAPIWIDLKEEEVVYNA